MNDARCETNLQDHLVLITPIPLTQTLQKADLDAKSSELTAAEAQLQQRTEALTAQQTQMEAVVSTQQQQQDLQQQREEIAQQQGAVQEKQQQLEQAQQELEKQREVLAECEADLKKQQEVRWGLCCEPAEMFCVLQQITHTADLSCLIGLEIGHVCVPVAGYSSHMCTFMISLLLAQILTGHRPVPHSLPSSL